jgi:hypothetical protein
MSKKSAVFGKAERLEILAAQKKQHPVHVTRRLLALKLKEVDGLRGAEAEKIAGMHTTSVNRIVKRYQEEGIEAIAGVRHHSEHCYEPGSPDEYILLLLDNAAWRHSSAMVVPDRVELFPLLPYTPELNPIEMIWDEAREKGFHDEIFKNLEAVIDRLCRTVKDLAEDIQRVASITHRRWLIDAFTF